MVVKSTLMEMSPIVEPVVRFVLPTILLELALEDLVMEIAMLDLLIVTATNFLMDVKSTC
jgi:hypothetical protein